jgi:hypothetical protein
VKFIIKFLAAAMLLVSVCNAQTPIPPSKHVYILMEENHRYTDVLARMPYLISLGNKYAHTLNYHADESGSMLDYLWITSGSGEHAFGCSGWGCPSTVTSNNMYRALNKAGLSWRSYQETLPYAGFMGPSSGLYVKRHNPAPWYSDIINSKTEQMKIVPFTQLATDIANNALPNYAFITPNLVNDAHNQVGTTDSLATADNWLKTNLQALLNSAPFQPGGDGVLFITFDECDGAGSGLCGGNSELVYTAVIGPNVKPGAVSAVSYKHENVLRTAMVLLGLPSPYPQAAATATPMYDLFMAGGLAVYAPLDGSVNPVSVNVQATDPKAVSMQVWVDYAKKYEVSGTFINTNLTLPTGTHRFVVQGVEAGGAVVKVIEKILVQ